MLQVFFLLLGLAFTFAGVIARAPLRRPRAFFDGDRVRILAVRRRSDSATARATFEVGVFFLLAALALEACQ